MLIPPRLPGKSNKKKCHCKCEVCESKRRRRDARIKAARHIIEMGGKFYGPNPYDWENY